MITLPDTPEIQAARKELLRAQTQQNRFDITIAIEALVVAMLRSTLPADKFTEKTGETFVETAKREREAVNIRDAEIAKQEQGAK